MHTVPFRHSSFTHTPLKHTRTHTHTGTHCLCFHHTQFLKAQCHNEAARFPHFHAFSTAIVPIGCVNIGRRVAMTLCTFPLTTAHHRVVDTMPLRVYARVLSTGQVQRCGRGPGEDVLWREDQLHWGTGGILQWALHEPILTVLIAYSVCACVRSVQIN